MLCSTICIPDHYGKGATVETEKFASFSVTKLLLRYQMDPDEARDILGATCSMTDQSLAC